MLAVLTHLVRLFLRTPAMDGITAVEENELVPVTNITDTLRVFEIPADVSIAFYPQVSRIMPGQCALFASAVIEEDNLRPCCGEGEHFETCVYSKNHTHLFVLSCLLEADPLASRQMLGLTQAYAACPSAVAAQDVQDAVNDLMKTPRYRTMIASAQRGIRWDRLQALAKGLTPITAGTFQTA